MQSSSHDIDNYDLNSINNSTDKLFYLSALQVGDDIELYQTLKNGKLCVTKRTKIGINGFVCPKFLREINTLKVLNNPPEYLKDHPGKNHIIKLLDVYSLNNYLHFDMEYLEGTLFELKNDLNINLLKEKILIDISNAVQYIHILGFNHCDISLSNIMYSRVKNTLSFKFILIDFGNAVHKSRLLTIEEPTYYTASVEIIDIITKLNKIKYMISYNPIKYLNKIKNDLIFINENFHHRKSDVWSLGALSYYLHYFDHYVDQNNLEQQKCMILNREEKLHDMITLSNVGHTEIIAKTQMMLIADHNVRPVLYFCTNPQLRNQSHEINSKLEMYNIDDMNLYILSIKKLLSSISKNTNRAHLIYFVNDDVLNEIASMCYVIESRYIKRFLKIMKQEIKMIFNDASRINDVIHVIRLLLLWLITHIFMNDVWNLSEIVVLLSELKFVHDTNKYNIRRFVENMCINICKLIDWQF